MTKAKYETTQNLRYNKLKLAPGDEISLEPKDAKPLLESGKIRKPAPEVKPETEPDKEPDK